MFCQIHCGPTKVWQGPGHFQLVHSGSSGKDLGWPQYPTGSNFRICGQLVHQGLGTWPLSLGHHAQGFQGGGRFEVSKFQTKPSHGSGGGFRRQNPIREPGQRGRTLTDMKLEVVFSRIASIWTSYRFIKMAAADAQYYFRFRICWYRCLQKVKVLSKPNFVDISQLMTEI